MAGVQIQIQLENTNATTQTVTFNVVAQVHCTPPAPPYNYLPDPNPAFEFTTAYPPYAPLGPFDGTIDYAGSSGLTVTFTDSTGTGSPSVGGDYINDLGLAPWVGPAGAPGNVSIPLHAFDVGMPR